MAWRFPWSPKAAPDRSFGKLSDSELVSLAFTGSDQLPQEWAREIIARGERMVAFLSGIIDDDRTWHKGEATRADGRSFTRPIFWARSARSLSSPP
ncbi:MAG: hypothetical protein AUJ52_11160 [Elusimicrobia bacterium CG1_02_63_36]|nr:MAG: hypothetical protein AUJ52_11160 [Elusimicrobia bacterium CG1_02_63_36]PIP83245.1 MAG: hypothetical protein COR54_10585 [Elusimicrobia bacterium CG22_combo_CG10-13_8_21_14_all_63_91]PJA14141.1 MAG: hypothetical protein COX66_13065 [Elusimicrobia bacterium CG_4_10_14_0_2_um_filter_63_34]PJB24754.1 MAG: hypothetical protein CO113_12235 [Elusimicrobia bacterium CG_4_9_14_3_um_filter_62_55]